MTTTIQVKDKTKEKLFHLKLRLSELEGESVSYNEVIERLLEDSSLSFLNEKKNWTVFRKYKGILPKTALKKWKKEKHLDFA